MAVAITNPAEMLKFICNQIIENIRQKQNAKL